MSLGQGYNCTLMNDDRELRDAILQLVLSHKSWQAEAWILFDAIERVLPTLPQATGDLVRESLDREKERIVLSPSGAADLLAHALEQALQGDQPFLDLLRTYPRAGR
jgi:hypothetical protein